MDPREAARAARISPVPWADPAAAALRARQRAEVAAVYGHEDSEPGVPPSASDVAVFFVARAGAPPVAVGCGGLRHLGAGLGEVKRMYVEPAWRGSGLALRILRTLEEWALAHGWTCLRLETGDRLPAAARFYERAGYVRTANFGPYAGVPTSRCYERPLRPAGGAAP